MSYTITGLAIQNNDFTDEKKLFLHYLNYCELFVILGEKTNVNFYSLHLYFSPNRPTSMAFDNINLSSYMGNHTQQNNTILETSKSSNGNFYQANVIYFIKKKRDYEHLAKDIGYDTLWKEDEEVQLLTKYFTKLGYTWEVNITEKYTSTGSILLYKDSKKYNIQQASSGEREIINFLLSICASNIKNGIIVIDEPEIHLHPRWQNFLLDILLELSKVTKNQFIISTHSPSFVNQKSYNYVFRFYKESNSSKVTELKLAEVKTALHVIKSSNNEKIFFADAIIFVEGIKDLLIFQPILEKKLKEKNSLQIVEIIDIGGKRNFPMFKEIAENIKIPYFFIADLDYVNEADKTGAIKKLFNPDLSEISKQMKSSKSEDGNKLAFLLEEAISQGNITEKLRETFEYVKSNRKKLRDDLSKDEQKGLDDFIQLQEENNIYILNKGAIEKYLPDGYKSKNSDDLTKIISSLLDTTKDDYQNWITSLEYADLEAIIAKIISKF